jgi:hypothetical protein
MLRIAILSNPRTSDFQLLDVDAAIPPDARARYLGRGLEFLGTIGLENGQVNVELDSEPSTAMRAAIVEEFRRLYGRALEQLESQTMGDSLEFLERLHKL